jgi:hypothetical protein
MAAWMIWAVLALSGFGQTLPEWLAGGATPKPPDSGVRDVNGVFDRDPGVLKRISGQLRQLETDHGYRICLMVEPVLMATTAPELAAHLQQAWLPDGNGLVIVFEAGSRNLGFGRDLGGKPDPSATGNLVPTHETAALLRAAAGATDISLAPEAYIETLVENLVREFNGYFERRAAPKLRAEGIGIDPPGRSCMLHTGERRSGGNAEHQRRTEHPFVANQSHLQLILALHRRDLRDRAAGRKVDVANRGAGLIENLGRGQLDVTRFGEQPAAFQRRQAGQQAVGGARASGRGACAMLDHLVCIPSR